MYAYKCACHWQACIHMLYIYEKYKQSKRLLFLVHLRVCGVSIVL